MHCSRPMHSATRAITLVAALLLISEDIAFGQAQPLPGNYPPGNYPPGTYPPGTYPPNTYPPDAYPPDRYPARLPGGIPISIQIPEIKLPGRGNKDKDRQKDKTEAPASNTSEVAEPEPSLLAVNGVLRKLSDKELLLELEKHGVLRFRVLAKTQFRDAKGETMRDSLLKQGDVLSAQYNPIDEETILIVSFVRAGTAEERAAAAKPIDPASIKVPEGLEADAIVTRTAKVRGEVSTDSRPIQRRRTDADAMLESVMPKSDQTIENAREQANGINESIPNFVVQQHTTRYVSFTKPAAWQARDVVSAEVAYVAGAEEYRNIRVNGKPSRADVQTTGSWSTGEFATTLQDVLSPMTGAAFTQRAEQVIGSRTVLIYDFVVPKSRSHWRVIEPSGKAYQPPYKGSIWIDKQTSHVLKVEQFTISLPAECPFENATWMVEYDSVRIDNSYHMLPVRAENSTCLRESTQCSRNEIVFRNYRKFSAESDIKYDKFRMTSFYGPEP